MLIFGDRSRALCPAELIDGMRRAAAVLSASDEPWIFGHARMVELFIEAAALVQSLVETRFIQEGEDSAGPLSSAIDSALRPLASAVARSWIEGSGPSTAPLAHALARLAALPLPERIPIKPAEGYAFYALYPEAYAVAARALAGAAPTVIGIRSIGLGLGAMVAAVTAAPLSLSVRPTGHPFRRELALSGGLREALRARRGKPFAVVDEGPGLSGSSFAAVARELEACGVGHSDIHLFPSHGNEPGGAASADILARWRSCPKHVVSFEELALEAPHPRQRLASWVEDLTGPALEPIRDIGGGLWRELDSRRAGLPASPRKERRKFILRSGRGVFLLRFAGLGAKGAETLDRARRLSAGGFTPEPLGLRHGFLVERWDEDAVPLDPDRDRASLIAHLAGYLGFRARHMPAAPASGATLAELDAMRRQNLGELFSADVAGAMSLPPVPPEAMVRRVQTDNRLHLWEWLRRPDGRIVKTDAADHCDAHDLVGCQDLAWDVVGAKIEFALSGDEFSELCARLRTEGCCLPAPMLSFHESCYLAFQAASFSFDAQEPISPGDRRILCTQAHRYRSLLQNTAPFQP